MAASGNVPLRKTEMRRRSGYTHVDSMAGKGFDRVEKKQPGPSVPGQGDAEVMAEGGRGQAIRLSKVI